MGFAAVAAFVLCAQALAAGTPAAPPPAARPATAPATPAKPAAAKPAPVPQIWFIAKTGSGSIAYDGYSIKPDPILGTVKITSILYMSAPQTSPEGKPFQYVVADDTIDCLAGNFQPASRRLLSADGGVVSRTGGDGTKWFPLSENKPLAFLKRIACQGAPLAKSVQAKTLTEAVVTMRKVATGQ